MKGYKQSVLNRDGHKCRCCNMFPVFLIHRILPRKFFPKEARNLDNIISCCSKCDKIIDGQYGFPLDPTKEYFESRYYYALNLIRGNALLIQ